MLNNPAARKLAAVIIDPPAKLLVRMKVSPDAVTLTGTIGGSLSMLILIPQGEFIWAFVLGVFFGMSDLLDGTMARMTGKSGPWGNFLDATLDRITDGAGQGDRVRTHLHPNQEFGGRIDNDSSDLAGGRVVEH